MKDRSVIIRSVCNDREQLKLKCDKLFLGVVGGRKYDSERE